jgi:hypothetical protein
MLCLITYCDCNFYRNIRREKLIDLLHKQVGHVICVTHLSTLFSVAYFMERRNEW